MEVVFSLIIFSWVMLIFASMTSFNFKFTRITMEADKIAQDYIANNTFVYKKLRASKTIIITGQKMTLDSCSFEIKDNKFFYNNEPLYTVLPSSNMSYIDGLIEIHLDLNNDLIQIVNFVIRK